MYMYAGRVQIFVKRVHHPVDKVVYKINSLNKMFLLDLTCLYQQQGQRGKGQVSGLFWICRGVCLSDFALLVLVVVGSQCIPNLNYVLVGVYPSLREHKLDLLGS